MKLIVGKYWVVFVFSAIYCYIKSQQNICKDRKWNPFVSRPQHFFRQQILWNRNLDVLKALNFYYFGMMMMIGES